MSRAFVKEGEGDEVMPALRVPSSETNYVTPQGLDRLRQAVKRLDAIRVQHQGRDDLTSQSLVKEAERDLLYYLDRLRTEVSKRTPAVFAEVNLNRARVLDGLDWERDLLGHGGRSRGRRRRGRRPRLGQRRADRSDLEHELGELFVSHRESRRTFLP